MDFNKSNGEKYKEMNCHIYIYIYKIVISISAAVAVAFDDRGCTVITCVDSVTIIPQFEDTIDI